MSFCIRRHSILALVLLAGGIFALPTPGTAEPATEGSGATMADNSAASGTEPDVREPAEPESQTVELVPMRAKYSAKLEKGIPFRGSATRTLTQREDGLWEYRFDVDSFIADIRESVILRWDGRQVIPLEYHYRLKGMMISNRSARLDFDWDKDRVRNDIKDKPWYMDVHDGVLDKLGFQLQLRQDLKAGKERMIYEIADGGKLKEYEFKVLEEAVIDTQNHGKVNTVLVEKVREPYKKRETHLWFAPEWDYLLVRMVQIEDDGTRYEINLDEARLPGKRIE